MTKDEAEEACRQYNYLCGIVGHTERAFPMETRFGWEIYSRRKDMLKFAKLYSVKNPTRGTSHSAGIDFYVPDDTSGFTIELVRVNKSVTFSKEGFLVLPEERILIPSGIKLSFPQDKVLVAFNKSSIAQKEGLIVGPCVIDADYREQVYFGMINTSRFPVSIDFGQKIVQLLLLDINYSEIEEAKIESLYDSSLVSDRKGGFGSTGST